MDGRVLVAYGSRMGSTAEIAASIADVLRARGFDVTLLPADNVHTVAPYDAVILGSAIYAGRWRREAVELLERERMPLARRRVWLFQVGVSMVGPDPDPDPTPAPVAVLATRVGAQRPVTFAGCLIPSTAKGVLPRIMARVSPARGDHRDWQAIRAWAAQVADQLSPSPVR
jgi:menaquinone-dependent protoporphyrinogen oxidase